MEFMIAVSFMLAIIIIAAYLFCQLVFCCENENAFDDVCETIEIVNSKR